MRKQDLMPKPTIASDRSAPSLAYIQQLAAQLGFQQCHISRATPIEHADHLQKWLDQGLHGDMEWMQRNLPLRLDPSLLLDGTRSVISVRMDYLPPDTNSQTVLNNPTKAYISRYSLGRDYHKLMRNRLAKLAARLQQQHSGQYRALVDSAPVLERYFAEKSGLGWIGKNTMLINRSAGSWFFLGEIFTDLELDTAETTIHNHCGRCQACIDICPTQAFIGPYQLDARKCISYLTIELKQSIPVELRKAMGNRVFGCDDCQLVCPWNRFAKFTREDDFKPRHQLDSADLLALFKWDEATFLVNTAGSPIRRIGYQRWLRNLSIGLGNAPYAPTIVDALRTRLGDTSELVREHVQWALYEQQQSATEEQWN